MKNLEIKEFRLVDTKYLDGIGAGIATKDSILHFQDSGDYIPLIDLDSADCLFSLSSDGHWIGWIGLFPVLDPFGRLGISEIQFGCDLIKVDKDSLLIVIHILLAKAKTLGTWSCQINLRQDSELIPLLLHSGFKLLGQRNYRISPSIENEFLILEKRLN